MNDGGVDVQSVADDFGEQIVVGEHFADQACIAVVEAAHGVEGVGCGDGSRKDAAASGLSIGIAVAEAHTDAKLRGVGDRLFCSRQFGSDGHDEDVAFGSLPDAVEKSDRRREELALGESSGAVTVVAQYAPTPWRPRKAPMWFSAESVASMTS